MNEVLKTIQNRFSCRGYTGEPIEQEKLDAIVKAALQSPTAMDAQRFKLIVITNKDMVDQLNEAAMEVLKSDPNPAFYERIKSRGGKVYYNAPCMVLVLKDADSKHGICDSGIMVQTMALAATSLGVDSVICAMASIPFSDKSKNAAEYKSKVGWEADQEFAMGILLGQGNITKEPHTISPQKVHYVR
ncbi:MAG: nitroreductase family protein [Defluviitaleaceae bacterium]|nr:nitroreductase family protein [Defluviitaleaceae bacterium]